MTVVLTTGFLHIVTQESKETEGGNGYSCGRSISLGAPFGAEKVGEKTA